MGRFINFRKDAYIEAIRQVLRNVQTETLKEITMSYKVNLSSNEFNTLDIKHIGDMMASASYNIHEPLRGTVIGKVNIGNRLVTNQYFRVVYYEYGTGKYMTIPLGYNPMSDPYRNPARGNDHRIYTWQDDHEDLGGNRRRGSGKKPVPIMEFKKNGKPNPYAQPIVPNFNLGRAFATGIPTLKDGLRREVRQLNPITYTSLRGIKVRA